MLQSYPSLSRSFAVATFLPFLPAAAVVSGTRMFRATGLTSPSSDTSSSSAQLLSCRRPLHLLPLLVPHHLSSSFSSTSLLVMRSTPRSLVVSLHQLGPPDQLFFLPVTVQISIPETPRGRWGCGPFVCAHQCLSYEKHGIRLNRHWALSTPWTTNCSFRFFFTNCDLIIKW